MFPNFKQNQNQPKKNKNPQPFHGMGQDRPEQGAREDFSRRAKDVEEFDMDGFKHQMAKISAILAWVVSIYFSYEGFKFETSTMAWIGWLLGFLVTCGEFIFNTQLNKLSLTLVVIGFICYAYGVYSNVLGFWSIQNPGLAFPWLDKTAAMSWFVGTILEVYPEAAFAWGMRAVTGDLVGNIASLAGGAITGQKRTFRIDEQFKDRLGK